MTHPEYLALIQKVNQLRNQVHLFGDEEISEDALDNLKMQITNWENQNPTDISPNSPNFTISGGVSAGFSKFTHTRRMLSLNDIFDYQELTEWQTRWQDYARREGIDFDPSQDYICEPKIDGLAISIHYKDGQLVRAITRGDGFVGEVVTNNILQINSIPKSIPDQRELEVRGEIFMTKSNFEILNQKVMSGELVGKLGKTGTEGIFANSRNVASGTIRQLDSAVVASRNLSFVAYNVFIY
jgi:DNA ligase (NAD+)